MLFETFKFQIKCLYMNIVSANMYQSSLWNRFQNRCLLILKRKMYESPSISLREVKSITSALYISLKFADIRVNFSKITKYLRFIAYLIFVNIKFKFWSFASFKLTIVEDLHALWGVTFWSPSLLIHWELSTYCIYLLSYFLWVYSIKFYINLSNIKVGGGSHVSSQASLIFIWTIADIWSKINTIRPRLSDALWNHT